MSYQYRKSAAERKAEALLRSKGWSVSEPTCPDCHGSGWISSSGGDNDITISGHNVFAGGTASSNPCPRGCPAPAYYFFNSTSNVVFRNNTVLADGTQGMRRGE